MRSAAVGIALVLAITALPLRAVPAAAATLNSRIDELAGTFPGGAAIWVADPSLPQPLYARNPDEQVITASLYKLALLAEAEHQVELGRLHYSDTIVIDAEDITEDGSFVAPGAELTLDDALEQMITISDNGTAMHLWRMLGPATINAYLEKSGIKGFRVALDESEDNLATARAVGTYFTLLAKRQLVSPAASDRMLRRLERQQINDRIPAQLPEGTRVAHKTGNLAGAVHDAGIVFTLSGPRVLVAMTWDTDDDVANSFIGRLASTVYASVTAPPAAARYRVPRDAQYAEIGSTLALDVTIDNIGEEPWTLTGNGRMGLLWELRDTANNVLARDPRGLALGQVAPGGSVTLPIVMSVPTRPGDAKLVLGLVDASGRALSSLGVATATIPLRFHLPFVAETTVRVPSLLHRSEASMIEVAYTALQPVRADDHQLALGWRFIDPATDRIVAQGQQPLGLMRTYQRAGTFFAPLVAPNVRGTYTLEYELRERGFIAGVRHQQTVEIGPPRTFGDEAGPAPSQRAQPRPGSSPARTPLPTSAPSTTFRPVPRASAIP